MPVRAVLNVAYALLVKDRDEKERRELDDQLYGFGALNQRAERALFGMGHDGGGDQP